MEEKASDLLFDLVENQIVGANQLCIMICKYLSEADIFEMLELNELTPRFLDEEEEE